MIPFAEHLQQARIRCGLKQRELADQLGVSERTIRGWEAGTTLPYPYHYPKIQEVLGITVDELHAQREERHTMSIPPKERESTYFVQDRSNLEEFLRLVEQDHMITSVMGGVFPFSMENAEAFNNILDVGCGTGGWLITAAKVLPQPRKLIGIDISKSMLDYARSQALKEGVDSCVQFQNMDALAPLSFLDNEFDLVNLRFGVSFIRMFEWMGVLREFQRVLRPEGVLRLVTALKWEGTSQALLNLQAFSFQAAITASYLENDENEALSQFYEQALETLGFTGIQTRVVNAHYRHDLPHWNSFTGDLTRLFLVALPLYEKITNGKIPPEYHVWYQQMLSDFRDPKAEFFWPISTTWGHCQK